MLPNCRFKCKAHSTNLAEKYKVLYQEKIAFDFTIIAGSDGTRIPTHRVVLCTCSDYFLDLFRNENYNMTSEKELPNVNGKALKKIVKFMYLGAIRLYNEDVKSVWAGAQLLKLTTLEERCSALMLNAENFLEIAFLAKKYGKFELQREALDLACGNFDSVCSSKQFHSLNEDQLCEFLSAYIEADPHYGKIFYFLLQWYRNDKINRRDLMCNLMSRFVRFEFLEGLPIVLEWNLPPCKIIKVEKLFVLNYIADDCDFLSVQVYNQFTDMWMWESWPKLHIRLYKFSLLVFNRKCFISGGLNYPLQSNEVSNIVQYLDLESMNWHELPEMLTPRFKHIMITLNGHLYLIGGKDKNNKLLSSVEKYDFFTRTWQYVSPIPATSDNYKAAVLNDLLYIAGFGDRLMIYNPTINKWNQINYNPTLSIFDAFAYDIKCEPDFFDITALKGSLYLAGTFRDEKLIFEYIPEDNTWKELLKFKEETRNVSCIALNNRVVTIGQKNCLEYDPQTEKWKDLAKLSLHLDLFTRKTLCTDMVDYSSY